MLKLPGFQLSPPQTEALSRALAELQEETTYPYPWDSLTGDLKARGESALPMVGYGSLVNLESASLTLGEGSLATAEPVVAFGVKRVFDYELPDGVERYPVPRTPEARAALNVYPTGRLEDVVNGILFRISFDEIPALCDREWGYDLVPVPCLRWEAPASTPFAAYLLHSPEQAGTTRRDITPHHGYYEVCRGGASQVDEDFLKLWLSSTYLADQTTRVKEWEDEAYPSGLPGP